MTTNTDNRNLSAKRFVLKHLEEARQLPSDFCSHDSELASLLEDLICVKAMGFRGVVLTCIVGQHIDPSFEPLKRFYDCHPRSIFEKGIFYALKEQGIPCGASDPLNVAKNTYVLDENWASGRRPQKAAMAAVMFLRLLLKHKIGSTQYNYYVSAFFRRLLTYAEYLGEIKIEVANSSHSACVEIANLIVNFVIQYPESGTVPQFIIGHLLEILFSADPTVDVCGTRESVFGTNTTSKKPADIWIEVASSPIKLFEITVKTVDNKRIDDCVQALHQQNLLDVPLIFVCRIPDDISSLEVFNNILTHQTKKINFVDISDFIRSLVVLLTGDQLELLLDDINLFLGDVCRKETTKRGWNKLIDSM